MSKSTPDDSSSGLIPYHDNEGSLSNPNTTERVPQYASSVLPEVVPNQQHEFYSAPEAVKNPQTYSGVLIKDYSELELTDHVDQYTSYTNEKEWLPQDKPRTSLRGRFTGRRVRMILMVVVVILTVLAVGLGVGLTRNREPARENNNQDVPSHESNSLILKDTSLSATISSEGNRHIFYQAEHGDILHSQFVVRSNQWLYNNMTEIMSSNPPRLGSPFASMLAVGLSDATSTTASLNQSIILLYVDSSDSLVALSYQPGGHVSGNLLDTALSVKKNSRVVKMTVLPVATKFTTEGIVAYESADEGFKVLHFYYYTNISIAQGNSGYSPLLQYKDITEKILKAEYRVDNATNITLPSSTSIFDCSFIGGYPQPGLLLGFLNLTESAAGSSTKLPELAVGEFRDWGNGIYPTNVALAFDSTITSRTSFPGLSVDSAQVLTWKTGGEGLNSTYSTQPVWVDEQKLFNFSPALAIPFPYSRLAWTASNSSNALLVYNQINGSTLVESQFIDGVQWQSRYVSLIDP